MLNCKDNYHYLWRFHNHKFLQYKLFSEEHQSVEGSPATYSLVVQYATHTITDMSIYSNDHKVNAIFASINLKLLIIMFVDCIE